MQRDLARAYRQARKYDFNQEPWRSWRDKLTAELEALWCPPERQPGPVVSLSSEHARLLDQWLGQFEE